MLPRQFYSLPRWIWQLVWTGCVTGDALRALSWKGDGNRRTAQSPPSRSALPRLRGGGPPHLQGVLPCLSQPWRCARPRARSPERATGSPAHRRHSPDRRCRAFAVEDHRISRGSGHAYPSPGDALVPERGARNGRREPAHPPDIPQIGAAAPSRWSPPHLQGFRSCLSQPWRCARPRARSPERATGSPAHRRPSVPDRRCRAFAVEPTASPGVPVMPIPALEMRSSLSAEPGTGDGNQRTPQTSLPRSALSRLRGGAHRISRGCCHAYPSPGDALVPERGARNGRREPAPTADIPQIGAAAPSRWRTTASPGGVAMPIPALEMRSSPSAEPGTGDVNQRTPQTSLPRSALPRLRGGAHRISRGFCHAHPSPGDALVPERGARNGRREALPTADLPSQIGAAAPSRWSPPHLQGVLPCPSQPWRCARPRGARSRPTAGRYLPRAWRISALPDMAFQSRSCSSQS
jgi:hypothetical protein